MALKGMWYESLKDEFSKPYYKDLYETVKKEYSTHIVYPPSDSIFNAFEYTDLDKVKVLILGQDPYHEPGQANGLCFSVSPGIKIPPSLQNIYKELYDDLGIEPSKSGDLTNWAKQGVLLLNTVLTVRAHAANSHRGIGWEKFTDAAIEVLANQDRPIVFILWGRSAKEKISLIHNPKHLIISSAHPSPLSARNGFFGSKPFSRTNDYLTQNGISPVDWRVD